jgi:phage shock protein B
MNGPIPFFLIVVGIPVLCGTAIILTGMILAATRKRGGVAASQEDARIMQEMHQSLLRLEKRIDALETLYFETERRHGGTQKRHE